MGAAREYPPLPAGYSHPVSASQLSTYELCAERWRQKYIDGVEDPGTEASELGNEVHKHMEDWLEQSIYPPESRAGKLAIALIELPGVPLPVTPTTPGTNEVEKGFYLTLPGGALLRGFADLVRTNPDGRRIVYDWKSTGNLSYAKDLSTDHQAAIYAAAFQPDELFWGYVLTKGVTKTKAVRWTVHSESVRKRLVVINHQATIVTQHHKDRPEVLPGALSACMAFGKPCFATKKCPHKKTVGSKGKWDMSRFSKIMNQEKLAAGVLPQGDLGVPGVDPVAAQKIADEMAAKERAYRAELAAKGVAADKAAAEERARQDATLMAAVAAEAAGADGAAEALSKLEAPKKGRPRGTKNKTPGVVEQIKELQEQITEALVAVGDELVGDRFAGSVSAAEPTTIQRLYINCRPGHAFTSGSELFNHAHKLLQAEGIGHYSEVDFGKGAGLFVQALRAVLSDCVPVDLVVESGSAEYGLALSVLTEFYPVPNQVHGTR